MITLDDRPAPPPLPQFSRDMERYLITTASAQTRQPATTTGHRRTRYMVAGLAAGAVAAGTVVGIGYATSGSSHTPSANQTGNPSLSQSGPRRSGGVHIHLAAFSVDTNPGGTVTLTLTRGQLFNPSTLRQALARAGVPAVVTVGSVCTLPGHPSNGLPQVISRSPGANGHSVTTTITPSAIPTGQKLSFGYFAVPNGGGLFINLVPANAPLTCTSTPPAPPAPPGHGSRPTR